MSRRSSMKSWRLSKIEFQDKKEHSSTKFNVSSNPVEDVGKFWKIKDERAKETNKKPDLDLPPLTAEIQLRAAEKSLQNTNSRLVQARKKQEKIKENLNKQWLQLKEKEENFRESFRSFNRFLRANFEKRERAKKKLEDDKEIRLNREAELCVLQEKFEAKKEIYSLFHEQVKKHQIYEIFLDKLVEASFGEFKDINDPIHKLESLMSTKEILQKRQNSELERLEFAKVYSTKFLEGKMHEVIGYNNILADLITNHNKAQSKTSTLEHTIIEIKNTAIETLSKLTACKSTIDLIYEHITKLERRARDKIKKNETEKLVDINEAILRIQTTRDVIEKFEKKNKKNGEAYLKKLYRLKFLKR